MLTVVTMLVGAVFVLCLFVAYVGEKIMSVLDSLTAQVSATVAVQQQAIAMIAAGHVDPAQVAALTDALKASTDALAAAVAAAAPPPPVAA
jgi:uncharacterized coiled-coil protein SlyX